MTDDNDDLDGATVLNQPGDPFDQDTVTESLDLKADSFTPLALPPAPLRAITRPTPPTKPAAAVPRDTGPGARGSKAQPVGTPVATPERHRPKLLSRTDITPELRKDLRMRRVADGYLLQDPTSNNEQTLNEYEVSLVRMLNGKRPVFELLDAVERLGIPVNLESFQKFVVQLENRGFLRPPQTVDAALDQAVEAAWPTRGDWESSVRALFQSGIRFLRAGKHEEAAGYFEALLEEDPDNIEARELLAMATSPRVAPRDDAKVDALAPTARQVPVVTVPNATMATVSARMPATAEVNISATTGSTAMQIATAPASMPMASAIQYELPRGAPGPLPRLLTPLQYLVIGMVLVLGGVVGFLVLDSRHRGPPAVIAADPPEIDPKRPLIVAALQIDASRADAARAIDDAPNPATLAPDAPVNPTPPDPVPDKKPPPAPVIVQQVHAPGAGEVTSFLRVPRKVRSGDKLFQIERVVGDPGKIKAAVAKVDEMTALAHKDPVYDPFLADARAELAKVRQVAVTVVKAPRAGWASPKVENGATVRGGQTLAEIQ